MHFLLIRHGQPRWSVDGRSQRDPELTELGHSQAELTAQFVADTYDVTHIVHSSAQRAIETAAPLVRVTGLEPRMRHEIREIDAPPWDDIEEDAVQQIFREARRRPPTAWWAGLDDGEPFTDFRQRVTASADELLAEHGITFHTQEHPHLWDSSGDDGTVAIVAHGGTNAVLITHLLGMEPPPWEWERFPLGHASVTHLRAIRLAGAHVFTLQAYNFREHLPADMHTS